VRGVLLRIAVKVQIYSALTKRPEEYDGRLSPGLKLSSENLAVMVVNLCQWAQMMEGVDGAAVAVANLGSVREAVDEALESRVGAPSLIDENGQPG